MPYSYGRSDSIYICRPPRSVTLPCFLSFNLNLIPRVHANKDFSFWSCLAPVPTTSNTREVLLHTYTPTLTNCLSLRCLWMLLSNSAWELGITIQARSLVSEPSWATRSECFHFSQITHPWLPVSSWVRISSQRLPTPPSPTYSPGLGLSENKGGNVAV